MLQNARNQADAYYTAGLFYPLLQQLANQSRLQQSVANSQQRSAMMGSGGGGNYTAEIAQALG